MFGYFDVKDENKNDVEYTEDRGDQRDLWSAGVGRAFRSAGSLIVSLTSVQSTKEYKYKAYKLIRSTCTQYNIQMRALSNQIQYLQYG